jgi:DNA polymerase-3 subunit beta
VFAVGKEGKTSTPVLCGINLKFGNALIAVSCDRHRLAEHKLHSACDQNLELTLPTKAAAELVALKGSGNVEITASQNQITFAHGDYRIISGVLGGTYPDTSRMFGTPAVSEATANAADFAAAVERAKVTTVSSSSIIRLQVADNEITITSKDDAGNATLDSVDAELAGDPITLSCNGQFLLDVLKRCGEKAHLAFTDAMKPIIITDPNNDKSRFLVLPYRTMEG